MKLKLLLLGISLLSCVYAHGNSAYLSTSGNYVTFNYPMYRDIEIQLVDESGHTCYCDFIFLLYYYVQFNVTIAPQPPRVLLADYLHLDANKKYRIQYRLNSFFCYSSTGPFTNLNMKFYFVHGRSNHERYHIGTIYPNASPNSAGTGYNFTGTGISGYTDWFDTSCFDDSIEYYEIEMVV